MIIRNLYLLLVMLILSFSSKASNDSCLKISETHWNTVSKEKNYIETYTDDDETKEKKRKKRKKKHLLEKDHQLILVALNMCFIL